MQHSEVLGITLWGKKFCNPLGLAAGFDKQGEIIKPIFDLGFGFAEFGTVTLKPQVGNSKPRVFRDKDSKSIINRMGFPGLGLSVFKNNIIDYLLKGQEQELGSPGILGINIGMNKDQTNPIEDYTKLIHELGQFADYFTINISSPNTPGLRNLQEKEPLRELLQAVLVARSHACPKSPPPILVKFAPDLNDNQLHDIAEVLLHLKIDGVILTNTTLMRPENLCPSFAAEKGGLSGAPLKEKSTEMIAKFYQITSGQIPIIGVGGVESAEDAFDKIAAGASLIQLYTGMIYEGPMIAKNICFGLEHILQTRGFRNISEAVGSSTCNLNPIGQNVEEYTKWQGNRIAHAQTAV